MTVSADRTVHAGSSLEAHGPKEAAQWVSSVEELVSRVHDGDRLAVSGFHFVRAPMAQLRALVARKPKNLWYVSWGGGLPLELLLAAGSVSGITFCFSSLDLFGLAPRFRACLETGSLLFEEITALAYIQGLEAAGHGMGSALMQWPAGSDVFPGRQDLLPGDMARGGPPLVSVPAIELDVLLLHAQRADEAGNVEITGARGLDLSQVFAARQVLVSVEERVPTGLLRSPGAYVLPRAFASALTVAPGGAKPTSCLPYYGTDYRWLQEIARLSADAPAEHFWNGPSHASPSERVVPLLARRPAARRQVVSALRHRPVPSSPTGTATGAGGSAYTVDELMTILLARQVTGTSTCAIGSSSPVATTAYLLAKHLWAPGACVISHNGCYIDIADRPMCLWAAEVLDYLSCAAFSGGDATYHHFYQRGLVTHEVVPVAQVDKHGGANNVQVLKPTGRMVRLPGQGGMADVANLHVNFSLYVTRHSQRALVDQVDFVSARRAWPAEERRRYGLGDGQVTLLTNLGQFRLDEQQRQLVLTHVHPGTSVEEVAALTGFSLVVAPDLAQSAPPSAQELDALRGQVDPLGARRLEFVAAKERDALITELLAQEEALLEPLCSSLADINEETAARTGKIGGTVSAKEGP